MFLAQRWVSFGSDDGLAPNEWQAIIWTNDGLVYWHICIGQPQWVNLSLAASSLGSLSVFFFYAESFQI